MNILLIIVAVVMFVVGVIFLITGFINLRKRKKEEGFADILSAIGVMLISNSSPANIDKIILLIASLKGCDNVDEFSISFNYYYFFIGLVLVLISEFLKQYSKKRIYVLNINGYVYKRLENYFKSLKMSNFEFKEREIDFVKIYKKMFAPTLNKEVFECIKEDIQEKITAFKNESKEVKRGYTGIAPIPFIMYAGTFLQREVIDEYYEFDKKETETYYKLTKNKKADTPKIKLYTDITSLNKLNSEMVLAISLTQKISDEDLSQFSNLDKVRIGIDSPKDNTIKSKEQLNEYKNFIIETIENISKENSNLKRIHLIYSGQSCLPLEIGKSSIDDTRLVEIISYQYERQNDIKYPWGIIINGSNKGELINVLEVDSYV